jgi:hypothetical protein
MTTSDTTETKPLWLSIEEQILALGAQGPSGDTLEAAVQQIAGELDNAGYNVSKHGGHLLQLRRALKDTREIGRPLLEDFNAAVAAFALEDVVDPFAATDKLINEIGAAFPALKQAERRAEVIRIVEATKLDLLVAKAKGMPDDQGIRLLIEEQVDPAVITSGLEITEEKLAEVNAQIEKERAERVRVASLLEKVEGKSDDERIKHLFTNEVSEALIVEMAQVDQAAIDAVKQAMEEELKEKKRLEEEAAAKRKAEAEGPTLENIPMDERLEHIEAIREIMEFSDQEKEIRMMCEQSAIPKCLVDIAVSEPDKLDELEKEAEANS